MSIPKFHKLYFPGLISLVFLPVMCIWYLISNNAFQKYGAIDIIWLSKSELNKHVGSRHGKKFDVETFRKYNLINITGDKKADEAAFRNLERSFNQLATKNDTVNGIKLSFGNYSSYGELIRALDFCLQDDEDQGLFLAPTGSEIFIGRNGIAKQQSHKEQSGKTSKLNNSDEYFVGDLLYHRSKPPSFSIEDNLRKTYKTLLHFWPSVLVFMIMIGLIIFKRRYFVLNKKAD